MQTIAFGVDKQWDSAVEHKELYLVTYDGAWWRIMWEKEFVYIYMIGSFWCAVKIDRTL